LAPKIFFRRRRSNGGGGKIITPKLKTTSHDTRRVWSVCVCVEGGRGGVMWAWEEAMSENERKKKKEEKKLVFFGMKKYNGEKAGREKI